MPITVIGKIPLSGVPRHNGRCSGRAILHLHQPVSVIMKSPDFLWSLPYSPAPSPTCLPISPGSCQPSILCSVQTVIPGSAVAQPQLKLPPQHQTALACHELLLFLKSQRGLSWLGRHFIAQLVGTKRGRQRSLPSSANLVRFFCLPQGLLVCWEVLPVPKASPMSYPKLYGLHICVSFGFVWPLISLPLVLRKHLSCFTHLFQ